MELYSIVIFLEPLPTLTASWPHGPICESRIITFDTPLTVIHAPFGFEIFMPLITCPDCALIGPEFVNEDTRGPALPLGAGAGVGLGAGVGVGLGVGSLR
jgi:hypothetical protein